MNILVTSDLSIGSAFPHVSSVARKVREARIETLREMINLANYRNVDALILAGNTLADNRIFRNNVIEVIDALRGSNAPVIVLPGLNDPFTPDNPFRLEPELSKPPVQIIWKADPLELGSAVLHPFPVLGRRPMADEVIGGLQQRGEIANKLSIGLICVPPTDIPSQDLVERSGLDVVLCGGPLAEYRAGRLVVPGTPESLDFDGGGGHVSVVELGMRENPPSVESVSVGRLEWRLVEAEPDGIEQALGKFGSLAARTLVRLKVEGFLSAGEILRLRALVEVQRRRFVFLEADIQLCPAVPENVPHPLIKDLLNRLAAEAGTEMSGVPDLLAVPSEGEIARWAILRLAELLGESPHEELSCI